MATSTATTPTPGATPAPVADPRAVAAHRLVGAKPIDLREVRRAAMETRIRILEQEHEAESAAATAGKEAAATAASGAAAAAAPAPVDASITGLLQRQLERDTRRARDEALLATRNFRVEAVASTSSPFKPTGPGGPGDEEEEDDADDHLAAVKRKPSSKNLTAGGFSGAAQSRATPAVALSTEDEDVQVFPAGIEHDDSDDSDEDKDDDITPGDKDGSPRNRRQPRTGIPVPHPSDARPHVLALYLGPAARADLRRFARQIVKTFCVSTVDTVKYTLAAALEPRARVRALLLDGAERDTVLHVLEGLRAHHASLPTLLVVPRLDATRLASAEFRDFVSRCTEMGADGLVERPLDARRLGVKILSLLDRYSRTAEIFDDVRYGRTLQMVNRYKSQHRAQWKEQQISEAAGGKGGSAATLPTDPSASHGSLLTKTAVSPRSMAAAAARAAVRWDAFEDISYEDSRARRLNIGGAGTTAGGAGGGAGGGGGGRMDDPTSDYDPQRLLSEMLDLNANAGTETVELMADKNEKAKRRRRKRLKLRRQQRQAARRAEHAIASGTRVPFAGRGGSLPPTTPKSTRGATAKQVHELRLDELEDELSDRPSDDEEGNDSDDVDDEDEEDDEDDDDDDEDEDEDEDEEDDGDGDGDGGDDDDGGRRKGRRKGRKKDAGGAENNDGSLSSRIRHSLDQQWYSPMRATLVRKFRVINPSDMKRGYRRTSLAGDNVSLLRGLASLAELEELGFLSGEDPTSSNYVGGVKRYAEQQLRDAMTNDTQIMLRRIHRKVRALQEENYFDESVVEGVEPSKRRGAGHGADADEFEEALPRLATFHHPVVDMGPSAPTTTDTSLHPGSGSGSGSGSAVAAARTSEPSLTSASHGSSAHGSGLLRTPLFGNNHARAPSVAGPAGPVGSTVSTMLSPSRVHAGSASSSALGGLGSFGSMGSFGVLPVTESSLSLLGTEVVESGSDGVDLTHPTATTSSKSRAGLSSTHSLTGAKGGAGAGAGKAGASAGSVVGSSAGLPVRKTSGSGLASSASAAAMLRSGKTVPGLSIRTESGESGSAAVASESQDARASHYALGSYATRHAGSSAALQTASSTADLQASLTSPAALARMDALIGKEKDPFVRRRMHEALRTQAETLRKALADAEAQEKEERSSKLSKKKALRELRLSQERAEGARREFSTRDADAVRMDTAWQGWMSQDLLVSETVKEPSIDSVNSLSRAHPFLRRGTGRRRDHDTETDDFAISMFTQAVRVDPRCAIAHCLRGAAFMHLSRFTEALEDFNNALALEPENPDFLHNRALALLSLGDHAAAMKDLNHALHEHDALWPRVKRSLRFDVGPPAVPELGAPHVGAAGGATGGAMTAGAPGGAGGLSAFGSFASFGSLPSSTAAGAVAATTTTTTPSTGIADAGAASILASTVPVFGSPGAARPGTSDRRPGTGHLAPVVTSAGLGRPLSRRGAGMPGMWGYRRLPDPDTLRLRAVIYRRRGKFDVAVEDYMAAIHFDRAKRRNEALGAQGLLSGPGSRHGARTPSSSHGRNAGGGSAGGATGANTGSAAGGLRSLSPLARGGLHPGLSSTGSLSSSLGFGGSVSLVSLPSTTLAGPLHGSASVSSLGGSSSLLGSTATHTASTSAAPSPARATTPYSMHRGARSTAPAGALAASSTLPASATALAASITSAAGFGASLPARALGATAGASSVVSFSASTGSLPAPHGAGPGSRPSSRTASEELLAAPMWTRRDRGGALVELIPPAVTDMEAVLGGRTDMFTSLFVRPTDVQRSLAVRPDLRTPEQVEAIRRMLSQLIFFRALDAETQERVAHSVRYQRFLDGEYVCREGAPPEAFAILMSGEAVVKVSVATGDVMTEITVDSLFPGDHFGELPLLFGAERTLSVVARDRTAEVLLLPADEFYRLHLDEAFIEQLEERRWILQRTGCFPDWSKGELLKLACTAKMRAARKGTVLVRQGGLPTDFFVLTKGIARVYKYSDLLQALNKEIREVAEELSNLNYAYSYHHSMRKGSELAIPPRIRRILGLADQAPPSHAPLATVSGGAAVSGGAVGESESVKETKTDARGGAGGADDVESGASGKPSSGTAATRRRSTSTKPTRSAPAPRGKTETTVSSKSEAASAGVADAVGGDEAAATKAPDSDGAGAAGSATTTPQRRERRTSSTASTPPSPSSGAEDLTEAPPASSGAAKSPERRLSTQSKLSVAPEGSAAEAGPAGSVAGGRESAVDKVRSRVLRAREAVAGTEEGAVEGASRGEGAEEPEETNLDRRNYVARKEDYVPTAVQRARIELKRRLEDLFRRKHRLLSVRAAKEKAEQEAKRRDREAVKRLEQRKQEAIVKAARRMSTGGDGDLRSRSLEAEDREEGGARTDKEKEREKEKSRSGGPPPLAKKEDGSDADSFQHRVLVETLYPPSIFGELAILQPWEGFAQASVEAFTYCELLVIPKTKLDHAMFSKDRLAPVAARAPSYPKDEVVREKYLAEREWKKYSKDVLADIDKSRWPVDKSRILVTTGGKQYILPEKSGAAGGGGKEHSV